MNVAQTNLQLYNQLIARGFIVISLADLYDKLLGSGSVYAPARVIKELGGEIYVATQAVINAASQAINFEVRTISDLAIQNTQEKSVPDCLTAADVGSTRIKAGKGRSFLGRVLKRKTKK